MKKNYYLSVCNVNCLINFSYFATSHTQITESKEKLKNLSQSLKTLQTCGKDCNIHMRDLIIDYNCITKVNSPAKFSV